MLALEFKNKHSLPIEEKLPIKPFTEEYKGIEEFRNIRQNKN